MGPKPHINRKPRPKKSSSRIQTLNHQNREQNKDKISTTTRWKKYSCALQQKTLYKLGLHVLKAQCTYRIIAGIHSLMITFTAAHRKCINKFNKLIANIVLKIKVKSSNWDCTLLALALLPYSDCCVKSIASKCGMFQSIIRLKKW